DDERPQKAEAEQSQQRAVGDQETAAGVAADEAEEGQRGAGDAEDQNGQVVPLAFLFVANKRQQVKQAQRQANDSGQEEVGGEGQSGDVQADQHQADPEPDDAEQSVGAAELRLFLASGVEQHARQAQHEEERGEDGGGDADGGPLEQQVEDPA